ncbi:putative glycosyl transferase, partial [Paenibacillus agaridevorans]
MDPSLNPQISDDILGAVNYRNTQKPKESWGRHPKIGSVASLIGNNFSSTVMLPKIAREIAEFAKENSAEIIWSVVQGQTMIKVVRRAAASAEIPYTVQVWDPPEWWLSENKFDKFTKNSVMKEFGKLLHNSRACMSASWSMAEEYTKEYQARCIPVVPGLDDKSNSELTERTDQDFIIAFAGQIYALTEFNALIQALELLNWSYSGKKIKLVLYGRYFQNLHFNSPANMVIRGWVDQTEVLKELSNADLLYCPYWFSSDFEKVARLSFPSKLTSYLKTKRPVLMHAPSYSSPTRFIRENNAGYVCESLSPAEIA